MKTLIEIDDGNFDGKYCHAARVQVVDDDGVVEAKYIDIKDLLKVLSGATNSDTVIHRIGKLPQYYYDGAINRDGGKLSGKIILIVPKGIRPTIYEDTKYEIPFPTMLFYFVISDGRVSVTKVYALKGKSYKEDTVLYNYPFGNVSLHSHQVCWGSNLLPDVKELPSLNVICSLFYNSASNNDYYTPRESTTWDYSNLREVYEKIKSRKEFPERVLVPVKNATIGKLVNELMK